MNHIAICLHRAFEQEVSAQLLSDRGDSAGAAEALRDAEGLKRYADWALPLTDSTLSTASTGVKGFRNAGVKMHGESS